MSDTNEGMPGDNEDVAPDEGHRGPTHEHAHHIRDAVELLTESGKQVEQELTPDYVETDKELQMGVVRKTVRAVGGFVIIGAGIALLPLPGPGWLVIIFGLALLPFAWAERTITRIRRTIPGIPEDGQIPLHTWIIMGLLVTAAAAIALLFGGAITSWMTDSWNSIWD